MLRRWLLEAKGVLGRNIIRMCPVPLPPKTLLLATFRGRILHYPDLSPDPIRLLSKCSSAREGWSAGMPSQTLGHRVLVKVAPEWFWDNAEPVFTKWWKTMNNLQTSRGCFPQTSTKNLNEKHEWETRSDLYSIFSGAILSAPESSVLYLLTPKSDSCPEWLCIIFWSPLQTQCQEL